MKRTHSSLDIPTVQRGSFDHAYHNLSPPETQARNHFPISFHVSSLLVALKLTCPVPATTFNLGPSIPPRIPLDLNVNPLNLMDPVRRALGPGLSGLGAAETQGKGQV